MAGTESVVICFQFVLWRYLIQYGICAVVNNPGCDLLSICSLTIFDTILVHLHIQIRLLWFAFNLFFDDIWYNTLLNFSHRIYVVICFQFVLWRYLIQYREKWFKPFGGCDLLSICSLTIFDTIRKEGISTVNCCDLLSICSLTIFDTMLYRQAICRWALWFAFNLFFDDIWYNEGLEPLQSLLVVICFQFVLWRYLIQLNYSELPVGLGCDLLSICSLTIFDTIRHLQYWF